MSSLAISVRVTPAQAEHVHTAETWAEMVALCLGPPAAEHRIAFGNGVGVPIVPGQFFHLTLSPNTEVRVMTATDAGATWSFLFTTIPTP